MEQMLIEKKAKFILDNKDKIIDNMASIKYELFLFLISDEEIIEDKNYNKINEILKNSSAKIKYIYKDAYYIIYALSAFIDRLPMENELKEDITKKLFRYIECFISMETKDKKCENVYKKQLRLSV